ncbi:unnamed protein product, partial [Meganyctiphanes norvegica]
MVIKRWKSPGQIMSIPKEPIAVSFKLFEKFDVLKTFKTLRIIWLLTKKGTQIGIPISNNIRINLFLEVSELGAVGFDCEWVSTKGQRRPVALMQLASCNGTCVLVRLSSMENPLPSTLKDLLADDTLLKFGVGIIDDKRHLSADYNIEVNGCVDIRHLAMCYYSSIPNSESTEHKKLGLSALAKDFLGKKLDKDWRVRASDWEAQELTKRQVQASEADSLGGRPFVNKILLYTCIPYAFMHMPLARELQNPHVLYLYNKICQIRCNLKFPVIKKKYNFPLIKLYIDNTRRLGRAEIYDIYRPRRPSIWKANLLFDPGRRYAC